VQINSLLKTITSLNIPAGNYSTTAINVNQVFNYSSDPVKLIGSEATQSLIVTLNNFKTLDTLLNNLGSANVTVDDLTFDVADKEAALQSARVGAFKDASSKFSEYLSLTSLQNNGMVKIVDLENEVYTPYQSNADLYSIYSKLRTFPSKVKVTANIEVTWRVRK
jgi:uncharacterized protein YggE